MSKIYVVTHAKAGSLIRFVRAQTLNGAVRAVARDLFHVEPASTDQIVEASQTGTLDILDALAEPEDSADPGPVPEDGKIATWREALEPGKIADLTAQMPQKQRAADPGLMPNADGTSFAPATLPEDGAVFTMLGAQKQRA